MSRSTKISLGLAIIALISSWIIIGIGFSHLGDLVSKRNVKDDQIFEEYQNKLEEQMERRFKAEHQFSEKERNNLKAELKEDTKSAKALAEKALTRPSTLIFDSRKPLPVRVITPEASRTSLPDALETIPSIPDTNPKHKWLW